LRMTAAETAEHSLRLGRRVETTLVDLMTLRSIRVDQLASALFDPRPPSVQIDQSIWSVRTLGDKFYRLSTQTHSVRLDAHCRTWPRTFTGLAGRCSHQLLCAVRHLRVMDEMSEPSCRKRTVCVVCTHIRPYS